MTTDDALEAAIARRDAARRQLLVAVDEWVEAQAVHVERMLLEEGRLTALTQAWVTEGLGDEVQPLRQELARVATEAAEAIRAWGRTADHKSAVEAVKDAQTLFERLTRRSHYAFGKLFLEHGYDDGNPGYARPDGSTWRFYDTGTGAARSRILRSDGPPSVQLRKVGSALGAAESAVRAIKAAQQLQNAADLWGD